MRTVQPADLPTMSRNGRANMLYDKAEGSKNMQLRLFPKIDPARFFDLIGSEDNITLKNLIGLKNVELDVVSTLMGIPRHGTKKKKIDRIIDLWDLRHTLTEYGPSLEGAQELANFYRRVELHDMARRAKIWKSGNKIGLAVVLLNWRDRCRRKGKEFLTEAKKRRQA